MEKVDTDLGLRHQSDVDLNECIKRYCEVFRPHAAVSEDDSFNELEKSMTHVLNMKIVQGEMLDGMGLGSVDRWTAREAMQDIPTDESLTSVLETAKDALRPLQEQIEGMLKTSEMGGWAEEDEIVGMARFLSYILLSRGV